MSTFRLKHGLPYGPDDKDRQYDVTLRKLDAGDLIDAELEAETLVQGPQGPVLVSSPGKMGFLLTGRSIASIGCINGPFTLKQLAQLDADDLAIIDGKVQEYRFAILATLEGIVNQGR